MNLSGNQKVGALLTAVLPLVVSIYGQQAERREQSAVRAAEQQARLEADRKAADASDSESAKQLNEAFAQVANTGEGTKVRAELCSTLHTSLELIWQSAPTPKTEAVVTAWLTYRPESDAAPTLLVCACRSAIRTANSRWEKRPSELRPDGKPLHEELIAALTAANTECKLTGTPSIPPGQATPTPTGAAVAPTAQLTPGQATPISTVALTRPSPGARIYLQVPDKPTKERIKPLQEALERAGYRVPGVEVVGDTASPRCAEVRYVYASDQSEANALCADLNLDEVRRMAISPGDVSDLKQHCFSAQAMSRYAGRAPNRVYELWLPRKGGQECPSGTGCPK